MSDNGLRVFVPSYGAGIMSDLECNEYDAEKKYIKISFVLNDIDLYIPENKLYNYKIRELVSEGMMVDMLKIIKQNPLDIEKKWGKRYRQNNDKIKTGDTREICEVIRDLYYLRSCGNIPPGENKILYKAENMLASEITLIFNINIEEALYRIRTIR